MIQDTGVSTIAHAIQLAVAPVFLLSGIAAMIGVMASRLARLVDRARVIADGAPRAGDEVGTLSRRAKLTSRAITLCTITALLICAVIAVLFVGAFLDIRTSLIVALLFVTAMLTFFAGLLCFLREILLAAATLRIGLSPAARQAPSRVQAEAPAVPRPGPVR